MRNFLKEIVLKGWIKVHRKIKDWEWYHDHITFKLFFHILISANHKEGFFKGRKIEKGQLCFGRKKLSNDLFISEQNLRTSLDKLKMCGQISIESTKKFSILTVINWESYQTNDDDKQENLVTNELTNTLPTESSDSSDCQPTHQPTGNHQTNQQNVDQLTIKSTNKLTNELTNTLPTESSDSSDCQPTHQPTHQPTKRRSTSQQNVDQLTTNKKLRNKEVKNKDLKNRFKKPTLEEIYIFGLGFAKSENKFFDPEEFYDHYESNGWMAGKVKMKDWKAACRKWIRRSFKSFNSNGNQKPTQPLNPVQQNEMELDAIEAEFRANYDF